MSDTDPPAKRGRGPRSSDTVWRFVKKFANVKFNCPPTGQGFPTWSDTVHPELRSHHECRWAKLWATSIAVSIQFIPTRPVGNAHRTTASVFRCILAGNIIPLVSAMAIFYISDPQAIAESSPSLTVPIRNVQQLGGLTLRSSISPNNHSPHFSLLVDQNPCRFEGMFVRPLRNHEAGWKPPDIPPCPSFVTP